MNSFDQLKADVQAALSLADEREAFSQLMLAIDAYNVRKRKAIKVADSDWSNLGWVG